MRILNTRKPKEFDPSEEDLEALRRLFESMGPNGIIIVKGTIEIDVDGNIILKKD